jgi:hypothetical protein
VRALIARARPPSKKPHVASFWGRLLDSVPRPAWSSPPEQSGPALTVQVIYEACGQPRTATCVEWSPLLLLKLRCCCRGLRAGKNSAQFYGDLPRSPSTVHRAGLCSVGGWVLCLMPILAPSWSSWAKPSTVCSSHLPVVGAGKHTYAHFFDTYPLSTLIFL